MAIPTNSMTPSRRAVLAGGSAVAVAAAAAVAILPATAREEDDGALIDAEREIARLYAELASMPGDWSSDEPLPASILDRIYRLEDFIATTPAAGLAGAAVKLRRLLDEEVGMPAGDKETDFPALHDVLAIIEREVHRRVRT